MTIDQATKLIKENKEARQLFEKALYWEQEAAKIDYVNNENCTQQDIDDFNTV